MVNGLKFVPHRRFKSQSYQIDAIMLQPGLHSISMDHKSRAKKTHVVDQRPRHGSKATKLLSVSTDQRLK